MELFAVNEHLREKVRAFFCEHWGSAIMVTRGRVHAVDELAGFIMVDESGQLVGLVTYCMENGECEIISLDSLVENQGIGTSLLNRVVEEAKTWKCRRIWLVTTNDNTRAIRFYQRRGFTMKALHVNAVREARKTKPEIPLMGTDEISILHEIEFELIL